MKPLAITISPLTQSHLEAAFELATESFIKGSTLHRALGIRLEEYREYLRPSFEAMVGEGLSVAAWDETVDKMIGCVISTDFHQHLNPTIAKNNKFAPLAALTGELCVQYQRIRTIKLGDAVLVDMGAVSTAYAGKGVYQKMRLAAQVLAKEKGYVSVIGELSSASTQHVILNRFGHQTLAKVMFSDFEVEGKKPFRSIHEPESIILAEGTL